MKSSNLLFTLVLFLSLHSLTMKGQVLFTENFETGFDTSSWIVETGWETGTSEQISSYGFQIPSHSIFAGINDAALGAGVPSSGSIITHQLNLTGVDMPLLTFDCYFINGDYSGFNETAKVLVSTDNMVSWTEMLDISGKNQWQSFVVPFGSDYSGKKINLAFKYFDGGGWNPGFCVDNVKVKEAPDYLANVSIPTYLDYTVSTPRQLNNQPLPFVMKIENYGAQPLNDVSLLFRAFILGQGTVALDTHLVNVLPEGEVMDTFWFLPTVLGRHTLVFKASHTELGEDFYQKVLSNAFELSDSTLAKDDGERDASVGMSFGDPNWYGYYGNEFNLNVADTLTGISVWMTTTTAGSFNLTVNALEDGTGPPTEVIFHSPPIEIGAGFNNWVYYPLPSELPLVASTYVFCVGQDTIQGVMGHGFDKDRQNLGYWIMSPVAGGGYPWYNDNDPSSTYNYTLMIRPHFKPEPIVSSLTEQEDENMLAVFPNPAHDYLNVLWKGEIPQNFSARLFDLTGRLIQTLELQGGTTATFNLQDVSPGVYFVKVFNEKGMMVKTVLKQ